MSEEEESAEAGDVVLFLIANLSGRIQGAFAPEVGASQPNHFQIPFCRLYISVTFLGSPPASFQFSSVHVYTLVSSTSSTS
jgi:hypothetical protein